MIIKGGARGQGRELGLHLLRGDTNERIQLLGAEGVIASDVRGALAEMEAVAKGGRTSKPLYHVSVSPEASERLTAEQWEKAADALAGGLGLAGHQRLIVLHTKKGRQHAHMVWNRVDAETLKTAHHSHNFRTHEEVARKLEREYGLTRVQGHHAERDGKKPPRKRPTTRESQQEARTGHKQSAAQKAIASAWEKSQTGADFRNELTWNGYHLARGDRRDFVIIDPVGGLHSIRSAVRGLRVAEIRAKFADLDMKSLPSIAEARSMLGQEQQAPTPRPRPKTANAYASLKAVAPQAPVRPAVNMSVRTKLDVPQLRPKPPSWAIGRTPISPPKARASAPATKAQAPTSKQRAEPVAERHAAEATALTKRHAGARQAEMGNLAAFHASQRAAFDGRHDAHLGALVHRLDAELALHNSRLHDVRSGGERAAWEQQSIKLAGQRAAALADEAARRAAAKAEMIAAQNRERQQADERAAQREQLELEALRKRQAEELVRGREVQRPGKEPGRDHEP